jgi:chemotaxis protein MotB
MLNKLSFFKPKTEAPAGPVWMIIFLDMMSLLLAFFILLFSMSTIKTTKWTEKFPILKDPNVAHTVAEPFQAFDFFTKQPPPALDLKYLYYLLKEQISSHNLLSQGKLHLLSDKIVYSLPSDSLFASARATLYPGAVSELKILGNLLRNIRNRVHIYGYTDRRKVIAGPYISNWELSLARSVAVKNTFYQAGYSKQIDAQGFGSNHPYGLPIAKKTLSQKEKFALDRRVDIVIYQSGTPNK